MIEKADVIIENILIVFVLKNFCLFCSMIHLWKTIKYC